MLHKFLKVSLIFATFAVHLSAMDGTLDPSFNPSGFPPGTVFTDFDADAFDDTAFAIVIQADQKIVVGGIVRDTSIGQNVFGLARYNTDGSLDSTFDGDGRVFTPQFNSGFPLFTPATNSGIFGLALQPDGKIVAVGFATIGGVDRFAIARYNTDGSLDTGFGINGQMTTDVGGGYATSVVILASGNIVAGGFGVFGGNQEFTLVNYLPSGILNPAFGTVLTPGIEHDQVGDADSRINALALQPADGFIVAAGFADDAGLLVFAVARYNPITGALDTANFGSPDGYVLTPFAPDTAIANAVKVQTDGKIVAGGSAGNDLALARYCTDGSLDDGVNCGAPAFGTLGTVRTAVAAGTVSVIYGIALQQDQKIVIAGTTTAPDDVTTNFLVGRYTTTGAVDTTFNAAGIPPGFPGFFILDDQDPLAFFAREAFAVAIQADGKIVATGDGQPESEAEPALFDFLTARFFGPFFAPPCPLLQAPRSEIVQAIMSKYCIC